MKKSIFIVAAMATLTAGITITGCTSSAEQAEAAQAKVDAAKKDLTEAKQEAITAEQKAADAAEWQTFKTETDLTIRNNETAISELKAKMKKTGKKIDAAYEESVDALEAKNTALKAKLDGYEDNGKSNWESFKSEFNHDMGELGAALKDLTVNNKK